MCGFEGGEESEESWIEVLFFFFFFFFFWSGCEVVLVDEEDEDENENENENETHHIPYPPSLIPTSCIQHVYTPPIYALIFFLVDTHVASRFVLVRRKLICCGRVTIHGTTTVRYLWETHIGRHYTPKASQERRGGGDVQRPAVI